MKGWRLITWAVLMVALLVWGSALFGQKGLAKLLALEIQRRALRAEVAHLQGERKALEDEVRRIREDPLYLERLARRELGMVKPGEILFIIVEEDHEVRGDHLQTSQ
ncbi:MAG: hypothetical protein DRG55_00625 [Deltaproteobacteria bacterium]|nr:MAG: hypothetical protein DRG55_00625 [Deltaproteobacteria bacterium]